MRNYGIRFSATELSAAYAQETLNRVDSYNTGFNQSTPEFVDRFEGLMNAYPNLPTEVAAIGALEGLNPEDELALDMANAMHDLAVKKNTQNLVTDVSWGKRQFQQGMLWLDSMFQPVSRGFKSAVVAAQETGASVPGTVGAATLGGLASIFQKGRSTQNFIDSMVGRKTGRAFEEKRAAYGDTEWKLALEESRKGKPLNLGAGWLPRSINLTETQTYVDEIRQGKDPRTAYRRAADTYGIPITKQYELRENQFKYTTKRGEQIDVSPGRIVAAQMLEPGTAGYSVVSGIIDGVFRLAADPMNLGLMYGAGVKTAMRTLVQSNRSALKAGDKMTALLKGFMPGKTGKYNRALFYGRTVDDVRATGWGQKFGKAIAELKGDEGLAFLNDIPEFKNVPAAVKRILIMVDDPQDVWNVLDVVAKGGNLTMNQFDNMFTVIKNNLKGQTSYVEEAIRDIDRIRELSASNLNFGLGAIPAKPTVTGEFFNFVANLIGKPLGAGPADVAPLRKFIGMFAVEGRPVKRLLGVGSQLKHSLPKHVGRAISLRPETTMIISNLDAAARNADDMLKLSFASPKVRGAYQREILEATTQKDLNEITNRINQVVAKNVGKQNPKLTFDVDSLMDQQDAYNAQMEELRQFFSTSAGGSIAFNGVKTQIRYTRLIKDLEGYMKKLGIEVTEENLKRTVLEAVPSMHLLSQSADNFAAQLIDPQDVVRATKAHQSLVGPEDSLLREWVMKPKEFLTGQWSEAFAIPRKALKQSAKNNRVQLKPKGPIDNFLDEFQNNVLKPAWMLRTALALRIAPEEAVRALFGGKTNFITTPFRRAALNSNKQLGFLGPEVRDKEVFQAYNNLGEIVFSTRMSPDDVTFLKNMIEADDLKDFQAVNYEKAQRILKHHLLETNAVGVVSDNVINAAVKDIDLRDMRFMDLTEQSFKISAKQINHKAKGSIQGYDGEIYDSMGEAIVKGGGFSTELTSARYVDLKTRKLSDADAFVSPYKEKEFSFGRIENIEVKAAELGVTPAAYIDSQIDNIFMDDDTIKLLKQDKHVLGTYFDDEGNLLIDVSVGLKGDNAVVNAVHMGMNAFQESIYVANRAVAEASGFGHLVQESGSLYLYKPQKGKGAADINIDSVIEQGPMEAMFKSNFDALRLSVDEVEGAAKGMPGGGLFTADESYQAAMGEQAVVGGFLSQKKDVAENSWIMVDKFLPDGSVNPRYWEGLWEEMSLLASDPNVIKLMNVGIDEMMVYLRTNDIGKRNLRELVERSFHPEDKIYLTDDTALRELLESYNYRVAKLIGNPSAKILDPITGKELSAEMAGRVIYRDGKKLYPKFVADMNIGKDTKVFQFIKSGGVIEGRDWVRYQGHIHAIKSLKDKGIANEVFFKEFIKVFSKEIGEQGIGAMRLPRRFDLKNRVSEAGTMITGKEIKAAGALEVADSDGFLGISNNLLEKGYGLLISKPSNWLNRDPLFRYAFYENALDVIKFMDEPTKKEFIKGAEVWMDGNPLWDDLLKVAKEPSVENTVTSLEQANKLLKSAAMNEVLSMFYSTSRRHVASDLFSKYIPFPEIWAEVATTWGKLLVDNPQKFNRARIAIDNGREAKPWDDENGFLSTDPKTGKLMFNYVDVFNVLSLGTFPLINKLVNDTGVMDNLPDIIRAPYQTIMLGQDLRDEGVPGDFEAANVRVTAPAYAAGLNLVAQNGFAPGFGPVVTIPMRRILNALGSPKWLRKFVLGDFENSGTVFDQLPAYAKKVLAIGGEGSSNEAVQTMFGNTMMDIYTAYVLSGLVDQNDPLSVEKYLAEAEKQAKFVYAFRAMAQFNLPTAVQPRIEVEDKNGTWWATQTLVAKYGEMLIKNGYDHFQTQKDFIEKFGINPMPLKQTGSYKIGKKPIKETSYFFWYQPENKKLLDALPNTAYYIFPDKLEDELYYPAYYQMNTVDLTPKQQSEFMFHSQAIFEYEKGKEDIRNDEALDDDEKQRRLGSLKAEVEDEYGGIDLFNFQGKPQSVSIKTTMNELRQWELYPQMKNSPEWEYVEKYLDWRDALLDVLTNGGTFTYGDFEFEYEGNTYTELYVPEDKYTSRVLTGTHEYKILARIFMTKIWNDIINESKHTNFQQLANEVLFFELSPNNGQNKKD